MPEERIEILRRGIDAFNARDIERMTEVFEPDIAIREFEAIPEAAA